ncbi:MAG: DUF6896 domain-containing protein [Thermoguttaceae bacterium]
MSNQDIRNVFLSRVNEFFLQIKKLIALIPSTTWSDLGIVIDRTNPPICVFLDGFEWSVKYHGVGVAFVRKTRWPVTIDVLDVKNPGELSAWAIMTYIRSRKPSSRLDLILKTYSHSEIEKLIKEIHFRDD